MGKDPRVSTAEDFINTRKEINYMENGKCVDCFNCCSIFSPVNLEELNFMKRRLSKSLLKKYISKFDGINTFCPFSVDSKCVIYNMRPLVCKAYACDKAYMTHTLDLFKREISGENKYRIFEILPEGKYKDILYEIAYQKYGYKRMER